MSIATELTPEVRARRLAIARDVLSLLEPPIPEAAAPAEAACKVRMVRGTYFEASLKHEPGDYAELQGLLPGAHCSVCMIGSLFLSQVRLYDRFKVRTGFVTLYRSACTEALADTFDARQLDLMEAAFEETRRHAECDWDDPGPLNGATHFASDRSLCHAEEIARAIMENVVENDGVFTVEPRDEAYDYEDDYEEEDEDEEDEA